MIERGILFDDKHSYYDFDLILSSTDIPPALPKTNYVDIPFGDGSIDLTEVHGEVKYYDSECKFTFTMNPASDLSEMAFEQKKAEISNALNGKKVKITLDKDKEYYWLGRCTIDSYLSDKRIKQIVIIAKVNPYKFKQNLTICTISLTEIAVEVNLFNDRKRVTPIIECTTDHTWIAFGDKSYVLNAGKHKILDFQLEEGNNIVLLAVQEVTDDPNSGATEGIGAITFTYQERSL